MYKIFIANKKTEKILQKYISIKPNIKNKLDLLKLDPRKHNGAHLLHGRLKGKWACWFGSNIRAIYNIEDNEKRVIIQAVGTPKIY